VHGFLKQALSMTLPTDLAACLDRHPDTRFVDALL
jgi:hypothetical protein